MTLPAAVTSAPRAHAAARNPLAELDDRLTALWEKQIFFVVGCQKSGTTWLQIMLNSHPRLCCRGEARFGLLLAPIVHKAAAAYNEGQRTGKTQPIGSSATLHLARAAMGHVLAEWLQEAARNRSKDPADFHGVGDKTPEHALCMPLLKTLAPNAKCIHIIRDGRDGAVSGWFHNHREADKIAEFKQRFPTFADYVGHFAGFHWRRYIEAARAFGRTFPNDYLEVRYERLIADPDPAVREMFAFLGVDARDEIVRRCRDSASFDRLAGRRRGEEDASSHFRKGVAGDWRRHFDDAAIEAFDAQAGPLRRELGYED